MKKRFVSVPIKLLVLVVGALVLLSAIFSYLSLSRLNQEFKQYQSDTLRKGNAQFTVQNNIIQQQLRVWLESFADIVRLKEQQNFKVLVQGFSAQFDTLQLNQNVENVWVVSANNEMLYLSNAIPKFVQASIDHVLEQQQPELKLYCQAQCVQLITVPVLNGKGDMAVVAMTVTLVDMVVSISQALENELAIISFVDVNSRSSTKNINSGLQLSNAKFISSTNTPLVRKLFAASQGHSNSETIKTQGIEVSFNESSYLVNLIPIANKHERFY